MLNILILVALLSAGCEGKIEDPSQLGSLEGVSVVTVSEPFAASITAQIRCLSKQPAEMASAVSPNGVLWLVTQTSTGARFRKVRPDLSWSEESYPFASVQAVLAHGSGEASLIADDGLWRIEDKERFEVEVFENVGPFSQLCGDLRTNAILVADQLYQKLNSIWLRWGGVEDLLPGQLKPRDGGCRTRGNLALLENEEGLWEIESSGAARVTGPVTEAWAVGESVIYRTDGPYPELWSESSVFRFPTRTVDHASAGGAYLWVRSDDTLLRLSDNEYAYVDYKDESIDLKAMELMPFAAGGTWVYSSEQVCLLDPGLISLSLEWSNQTVTRDLLSFDVSAPAGYDIVVTLREKTVEGLQTETAVEFDVELSSGFNPMVIRAHNGTNAIIRHLQAEFIPTPLSWAADIFPIYQNNCADSACHVVDSSGGAPNLSNYDAWVSLAANIESRIVLNRDMPPLSARTETWTEQTRLTIRDWLDGGLNP